jgi:hypothetical protein
MKNIDFTTLKKNVSEKLKTVTAQYAADNGIISAPEAFVMLPLIAAVLVFIVSIIVIENTLVSFCFALLAFVLAFPALYLLNKELETRSSNFVNANKLLLGYFFDYYSSLQDKALEKDMLINNNLFVRANKSSPFEEKIEWYAAEASIANFRTTLLEYQKGLLVGIRLRDSMEHNLYLVTKNMRCDFLKLLQTQKFSYFPSVDKLYNIYSGFRGETAAFVEKNERIFKQIADLVTQNIILAFLGDEIYLYYENFDLGVFTNHNRHIDLESKNFENSYYQLRQIQQILQLLSKVK